MEEWIGEMKRGSERIAGVAFGIVEDFEAYYYYYLVYYYVVLFGRCCFCVETHLKNQHFFFSPFHRYSILQLLVRFLLIFSNCSTHTNSFPSLIIFFSIILKQISLLVSSPQHRQRKTIQQNNERVSICCKN